MRRIRSAQRVLALLKPLLEDEKLLKVGQNFKDRGILATIDGGQVVKFDMLNLIF